MFFSNLPFFERDPQMDPPEAIQVTNFLKLSKLDANTDPDLWIWTHLKSIKTQNVNISRSKRDLDPQILIGNEGRV
jgi:hypothetical protein